MVRLICWQILRNVKKRLTGFKISFTTQVMFTVNSKSFEGTAVIDDLHKSSISTLLSKRVFYPEIRSSGQHNVNCSHCQFCGIYDVSILVCLYLPLCRSGYITSQSSGHLLYLYFLFSKLMMPSVLPCFGAIS
jgi:hypothetical protein